MPLEVRVPDLGDALTSARVTAWLKAEGQSVNAGEPIAEIETDKTSIEIPSPASGVLHAIHVPAGSDDVPAGAILGVIVEADSWDTAASGADKVTANSPAEWPAAIHEQIVATPGEGRPPEPEADEPSFLPAGELAAASPLALRMAAIARIPLTEIPGTGPGGRVRKDDVLATLRQRRGIATPVIVKTGHAAIGKVATGGAAKATPAAVSGLSESSDGEHPLSAMRRVTAERLLHAKQTIPHFYLRVDCVADRLLQLRSDLNRRGGDPKLSVTVFAVRAAAMALRKVTHANSSWADGAIRIHRTIDIAVAVNTPAGLVTPIIREADGKALVAISQELRTLTTKAREGRLEPKEYIGGTFTISNLGMYGVSSLYPIINPPQSCILGIGAIEQRPIVRSGGLAIGSVVTCTLAADHRVIDGATGAELLGEIRRLVENPGEMVL